MFPPVENADEDGLLCWGGDLSGDTLEAAYRSGVFPWPHRGLPLLWFAPPERAVLFFDELHVGSRLRRLLRRMSYEIRYDTVFERVLAECAAPRLVEGRWQRGTWITAAMKRGVLELHRRGLARSVEAWHEGELVGGLYGVQIGRYFAGESMFTRRDAASKACVLALVDRMREQGAHWLDCEVITPHFAALGAREIPRDQFMRLHADSIANSPTP